MVDNINIDLDEAFLKKFFGLTDRIIPDDQEITMAMLRRQLEEIELSLEDALRAAKGNNKIQVAPIKQQPESAALEIFNNGFTDDNGFNIPKKHILVIDDLGVITYQLNVLLKQISFEVTTSKEIYDAIEKFKKQNFDMVIMDLFIPTEREGLILLEELKKISASKQKPVRIGIMSASNKKEHKHLCKMKGAEFYIEKIDDWQKEIVRIITQLK